MGLDPWTIIGLTGNIVQFIDFTSKIVSASIEIYQSASGATLSNQDAEFVADDLAALTMRLESSLRPRGVHLALNENEQRLEDLRCRCENVAWALLVKLEKLRGKGKGDGKVKSLGKAIRNVWSKSDVEAIEKSLGDLRRELELRVLVEMKNMVDLVAIKQSEDFEWLSEQTRALVDALLANCTKVAEILERHAKKMEDLQSKTETHVTDEHSKTRLDIATVKQDIIQHGSELGKKATEQSIQIHAKMVTVQQDIISQNTTEHDSTRDLIRKQMKQAEDLRREMNEIIASVEASLKPFLSSSKRRSEEERKKVQERGKRAEAALEAKRIILEQIEVSLSKQQGPNNAVAISSSTVPAKTVSLEPKKPPQKPNSTDMSQSSRKINPSKTAANPRSIPRERLKKFPPQQKDLTLASLGMALRSLPESGTQASYSPPLFVYVRIGDRQPLVELDITQCRSDQMFFAMLRSIETKGWPFFSPRKVEFAKFCVDDLYHVRILSSDRAASEPVKDNSSNWEYSPRPMRIIPPVGSQALIDYVINPSNANEYALTMLESIPKSRKRVEEMLKNGQQIVWGLEMKHSLGGL